MLPALLGILLATSFILVIQSAQARSMDGPLTPGDVPFYVEAVFPSNADLDIAPGENVSATMNTTINASTVNSSTFVIHAGFTGHLNGFFSIVGGTKTIEFDPFKSFKAGEAIQVTASSSISDTKSEPLKPHVWNFTADVKQSGGLMTAHPISPTLLAGKSTSLALGDLDGDKDLDVVFSNHSGGPQRVFINIDWSGGFIAHPISPTFGMDDSLDIELGDLDGDGDLDAVVANYNTADTVWLNDGTGGFVEHGTFGLPTSTDLALGDLDGDGDLDVVVTRNTGLAQRTYLNDGDGVFSSHPYTATFGLDKSSALELGDLDNDGDLDAVIANYNEPQTTFLNDGGGGFYAHPISATFGGGFSYDIALGDLDGDGFLDAMVANYVVGTEKVWRNDGSGGFIEHDSFGYWSTNDVALGDLDGDGDLDAIVVNHGHEQTVWLNDGFGYFNPHPTIPGFGETHDSRKVALGDLDQDGDLDAVFANFMTHETVWLNQFYLLYLPLTVK